MFDAIIVGSGPAGVSAAYQLRSRNVLLIDAGLRAPKDRLPEGNIYDLREKNTDLSPFLLGNKYESLVNLDRPPTSSKLKAPLMRFVTEKPAAAKADTFDGFELVSSYAAGGLANAWGAGVFRFSDRDLVCFPIKASELDPYYSELDSITGISGRNDDLARYFGECQNLHEPLPLSPLSETFLRNYSKRKANLNQKGIWLGRCRSAVITHDLDSRSAYRSEVKDFFEPNLSSNYNPSFTLDKLIANNEITYRSGFLVERYEETPVGVRVFARTLDGQSEEIFEGRSLILAAGTANTTRMVLASNKDYESKLPFLDNPVTFMPLIYPFRIGAALPTHFYPGAELILMYDGARAKEPILGSFYGLSGPLRTDLLVEFPLSMTGNRIATKYLVPALAMLQLFYPDDPSPETTIQLKAGDNIHITSKRSRIRALEGYLLRELFKLGFIGLPNLCQMPPPGSSIHYAGSLPMRDSPRGKYECNSQGLLSGTRSVYIADGASFSRLPSKNLTYTIMANAMRIADCACRALSVAA